jgi:hypothetical protein
MYCVMFEFLRCNWLSPPEDGAITSCWLINDTVEQDALCWQFSSSVTPIHNYDFKSLDLWSLMLVFKYRMHYYRCVKLTWNV